MKADILNILTNAIVTAIILLLVVSPVAYSIYKRLPKPIAVVDVQKLMQEHESSMLVQLQANNGSVTDQQRQLYNQSSLMFAQKLSFAVEQLGKDCQCILVNKAALLTSTESGIIDYTATLRESIKK